MVESVVFAVKEVHKSRFNDFKLILSLLDQSPISVAGGRGISPRKARSSLRSVRRWSGRVTCHGRYTVEGAAFSALDFFPGGAPKKRPDASNGFSSLWSAKLRSLPRRGSDILSTI
jgi:hypothetical protein